MKDNATGQPVVTEGAIYIWGLVLKHMLDKSLSEIQLSDGSERSRREVVLYLIDRLFECWKLTLLQDNKCSLKKFYDDKINLTSQNNQKVLQETKNNHPWCQDKNQCANINLPAEWKSEFSVFVKYLIEQINAVTADTYQLSKNENEQYSASARAVLLSRKKDLERQINSIWWTGGKIVIGVVALGVVYFGLNALLKNKKVENENEHTYSGGGTVAVVGGSKMLYDYIRRNSHNFYRTLENTLVSQTPLAFEPSAKLGAVLSNLKL